MTWNATISFLAPKMCATRPSQAELRALAGGVVSSRSIFSPSLTIQTRRTPALAIATGVMRSKTNAMNRTPALLVNPASLVLDPEIVESMHPRAPSRRLRMTDSGLKDSGLGILRFTINLDLHSSTLSSESLPREDVRQPAIGIGEHPPQRF